MRYRLAAAIIAAAAASGASAHKGPTDPEIAHIAYTAGAIDVAAGEQALRKSKNPAVRAFAEEMVRDHKAVNDKALALVGKLKVTPADNDTSKALAAAAKANLERLSKLDGASFDRAYANNEIAFHRAVNTALRATLIPSADNGELKALLETGLMLFTEHQHHAEHLGTTLQ